MRNQFSAIIALSLCLAAPGAYPQEPQSATSHAHHHSHADAAATPPPGFAGADCPPADAAIRADKIALGIIERCAEIELFPNAGAFKLATYLPVDAGRARFDTADGITVETAPGRVIFSISQRPEFAGYMLCNLDRTIRSEVPRAGRFKPKHGWVYTDARTASYHWDVKSRVSQGSTAPHLRVAAHFVAIPSQNLAQGIERKWCRAAEELRALQSK